MSYGKQVAFVVFDDIEKVYVGYLARETDTDLTWHSEPLSVKHCKFYKFSTNGYEISIKSPISEDTIVAEIDWGMVVKDGKTFHPRNSFAVLKPNVVHTVTLEYAEDGKQSETSEMIFTADFMLDQFREQLKSDDSKKSRPATENRYGATVRQWP